MGDQAQNITVHRFKRWAKSKRTYLGDMKNSWSNEWLASNFKEKHYVYFIILIYYFYTVQYYASISLSDTISFTGLKDWEKRLVISDRAHIGKKLLLKNKCLSHHMLKSSAEWHCSLLNSVWLSPGSGRITGSTEASPGREEVRSQDISYINVCFQLLYIESILQLSWA